MSKYWNKIVAHGTFLVCCFAANCLATETLFPIDIPESRAAVGETVELDDDVYSTDLNAFIEFAPARFFSIYASGAFRFLSYSYEYTTEGYIHNYCNLHVNGFNETYVGAKILVWHGLGINANWRFPPGEGSQENRFHRLNVEPFYAWQATQHLVIGTSVRYNMFLEDLNYKPGDEIGLRGTLAWKFLWSDAQKSGWKFTEQFLYQKRIVDSENRNLLKPYRKMKDTYSGIKFDYEIARYFGICSKSLGIGLNYQIQKGNLFGFETGHLVGLKLLLE